MKKAGEFFTIRRAHFSKACRLGEEKGWLGNGIAYLVLAKSTNATQRIATAGVDAIERRGKLSRGRATEILSVFAEAGIVQPLGGSSGAPTYELLFDETDEEQTWLPNAIVDGTIKIVSPLKVLKETRKLAVLETFLDVYDNHENSVGGLSLDLLHLRLEATKEHWPVPLNEKWNVWQFWTAKAHGSWVGTERRKHVRTLIEAGLLYETGVLFGDDGPDDTPLFSMCATANKTSNERLLFDALYKLRKEDKLRKETAWLIPLQSEHEAPVLRFVLRPFALAETERTLSWQLDRSRIAKAWLEGDMRQATEAIKEHDAAKNHNYNGRPQREASIAAQLAAIVNKHLEPPKEKPVSPEEMAVAEPKPELSPSQLFAKALSERQPTMPVKAPPRPKGAGILWGTGIDSTPPAEAVSAVSKR